MARVKVTVREGPKVSRHRCDSVAEGVAVAREQAHQLSERAHARPVHVLARKLKPVEQVVGRIEVSVSEGRIGRPRKAGVDVRGDGSLEAYSGGITRRVLEAPPGESVFEALARVLFANSS